MDRIFLLFHGRFPSEKAASLFAGKGAEAFARAGKKVTLLAPRRRHITDADPFQFYNVEKNFDVVYLPALDLFGFVPDKLAFLVSAFVFSCSSFFYASSKTSLGDVIYSNEALPLLLISFIRPKCFFEMHDFPESKLRIFSYFLGRMKWVLVHNKWKLAEIDRRFPKIPRNKFIYEPNAVDLEEVDLPITKEEARDTLLLPRDKVLAIYTGHLYDWKGVDTLAMAADSLSDFFRVIFVGGTKRDVEMFKGRFSSSRIHIIGHRPHKEIPIWQKAADMLVIPNTGRTRISTHYTSPMKLFEYMASHRPIIASDIPSIRELMDHQNAVLVPPDDPEALAAAIDAIAGDYEKAKRISDQAYDDVRIHTWQARALRILGFMEKNK